MPFIKELPEWKYPGSKPPQTKLDEGWQPNDRPPSDWFNWLFNTIYLALLELQEEAINIDQQGEANGVATLDATGDLPLSQADNVLNWVKGFGMGGASENLPSGTDLNTQTTNGFYYCSSPVNGPGTNGHMLVMALSGTYSTQFYIGINGNMYMRINNNGVWGAWVTFAKYDNNGKIAVANLPDATTSVKGIAQLNDAIDSTSVVQAATANAVKKALDTAKAYTYSKAEADGRFETPGGAQTKASAAETNAKSYANAVASTAETNAKNHGNAVASTAETNAKNYADSVADTAETNAKNASAPIGHIGAGGSTAHPDATTTKSGFMNPAAVSKLNGIAAYANNYVHPATHPASIITEDATKRFVSDIEKNTWNAKETPGGAQTKADAAYSAALAWARGHGLGDSPNNILPTSQDLNKVIESGFYRIGATPVNSPGSTEWCQMIVARGGADTISQMIINSVGNVFVRSGNPPEVGGPGTWKAWQEVETVAGATAKVNATQVAKLTMDSGLSIDCSGQDLNKLITSGFYYGNSMLNAPATTSYHRVWVMMGSSTTGMQLAATNANTMYIRNMTGGVWNAWSKFGSADALDWKNATLQNGVIPYSSGLPGLQYAKRDGIVYLRGAVKNIGQNEITIATLPTGYRPSGVSHVFAMPTSLDGSGFARFARWSVSTLGIVEMYSMSGGVPSTGFWFPINTCYPVDE
ncbi:tail fiber protein [Mesobacillus zeae]|uniref:Tail fiber protein n=1 Tax=Mesobacillus zeae TaxID=1917180 RepID=A0A398B634_9BACI|nr:tail fiber protein [Mesobacillus zeae]RID85011.1 hypothetical protein D1970_10615 [Mesobacillus zeae]